MNSDDSLPRPDYEPQDASPGVIAATAGVLAGIIGICLFLAALTCAPGGGGPGVGIPGGPEGLFQNGADAKTGIEVSWADADRSVRDHLGGYAWVDRKAGIVRIPIDRAIELLGAEENSAAAAKKASPPP